MYDSTHGQIVLQNHIGRETLAAMTVLSVQQSTPVTETRFPGPLVVASTMSFSMSILVTSELLGVSKVNDSQDLTNDSSQSS